MYTRNPEYIQANPLFTMRTKSNYLIHIHYHTNQTCFFFKKLLTNKIVLNVQTKLQAVHCRSNKKNESMSKRLLTNHDS